MFREIEEMKRFLALQKDFNLMDTFRLLDLEERGEINKQQF